MIERGPTLPKPISGNEYSVIVPVGAILPILLVLNSVNQRLPSGPSAIDIGSAPAEGMLKVVTVGVAGHVARIVGTAVGVAVGVAVGAFVGVAVGIGVGVAVGTGVGVPVGAAVGVAVGALVGVAVATAVGVAVATADGVEVGAAVGVDVGACVGVAVNVGAVLGVLVGATVGDAVAVGAAVGPLPRIGATGCPPPPEHPANVNDQALKMRTRLRVRTRLPPAWKCEVTASLTADRLRGVPNVGRASSSIPMPAREARNKRCGSSTRYDFHDVVF